jgi:hypothetical protein
LLVALWTGVLTGGALAAACLAATAQLAVAAGWLLIRHPALLASGRSSFRSRAATGLAVSARFRQEQRRSAQLWLALWLAPQLLTPIVLKLHGGDDAGRLGVTLALAIAPLSLATAWLHGRYPSFGALVSEGRTREFDALAKRATGEAVGIFIVAAAALTLLVLLLPALLPVVARRILPLPSVMALLCGAFASLLLQAMAGWLRTFRDDKIAGPIVAGAAATILVSGITAAFGDARLTTYGFGIASIGIAVPIAFSHFARVRRERLRQTS